MKDHENLLDLDGFLPYRLAVLAARVSKAMSVLYAEKFGISIAEWRVIANLAKCERVSIRDIHACVNLDKVKVSRAVARLEGAGLVLKASNASDNRLLEITLSEEGWSVYRQIVPLARGFEANLLSVLDDSDRAALDRVFKKLHAKLNEDPNALKQSAAEI